MHPGKMRALLSLTPEGTIGLAFDAVPLPYPADDEVRIRVRACGLSFPDLLMLEDKYQARPQRPFIPGMEVSGEIDAVGAAASGLSAGDRVFAVVAHGGLADYVVAPVGSCVRMPAEMPFEHGAAFISTYATAYHAFRQRGALRSGETLLVLGAAGGVGLASVQLGKALGAHVFAAVSSTDKLALTKEHGAENGIIYPAGPLDAEARRNLTAQLKALTGLGFDLVCDIVGGSYTEAALRALAWKGRLLIVGFPAGIARIPMNLPLLKGCQIIGVFCGAFMEKELEEYSRNTHELLGLYRAGQITPFISARYSLEDGAEALALLGRRQATGKIVVTMD